ncbi:MAG: hypothetical protein H6Q70_4392 [Firmicutes bacterium]|nr:hypothetical protein [Bacillota bacterium]
MDYLNKNKLRMVFSVKKNINILTFSIFIMFVSSIYSLCYATPSNLSSEQIKSETVSLKIFHQKMKTVLDLTKFIAQALEKPYRDDETEQKLISKLHKADELLNKLLERDLPIPNTTTDRRRIYISCFSTLNDISISGRKLSKEIINYRQNKTPENKNRCDHTLLELHRNINILEARFATLN